MTVEFLRGVQVVLAVEAKVSIQPAAAMATHPVPHLHKAITAALAGQVREVAVAVAGDQILVQQLLAAQERQRWVETEALEPHQLLQDHLILTPVVVVAEKTQVAEPAEAQAVQEVVEMVVLERQEPQVLQIPVVEVEVQAVTSPQLLQVDQAVQAS